MAVNKTEKGLYVVFEGPDNGGKSTQARIAVANLESANIGRKVLHLREPGGTVVSEEIRDVILKRRTSENMVVPRSEFLLFSAARAQLVDTMIKPALDKGFLVVCERNYVSSLVLQGVSGVDVEEMKSISAFATDNIVPDKILLFDIPIETIKERLSKKANRDTIELRDWSFHEKVREAYLQYASENSEIVQVIDGRNSVDSIAGLVLTSILSLL